MRGLNGRDRGPHLVTCKKACQRLDDLSVALDIPAPVLRTRLGSAPRIYPLSETNIQQVFEQLKTNSNWNLLNRLMDETKQQQEGGEEGKDEWEEKEARLKVLERVDGLELACAWVLRECAPEKKTGQDSASKITDMPADLLKVQSRLIVALERLNRD